MRLVVVIAALSCAFLANREVHGAQILIKGARVYTQSASGVLESTDVLVRDGKIAAVGPGLTAPSSATVVDAGNRPLTPGLFAGLSNIGLAEVAAETATDDGNFGFSAPAWQQQWRPEFDVTLAFNPRSTLLPVARIEGLTWTVLQPYSQDSVISGTGAAVTLDGRYDAVLDGSRSLFIRSGSATHSVTGGSRAAAYMLLDQAIREARSPGSPGPMALLHSAGRETLRRYLAGGRVLFDVERAADIRQVLEFARRNGLKPVICGGSEAWLVASDLASAAVPVILDPLNDLPESFDQIGARLDNATLLNRAGVRIAFSSGDSHNARKIRQLAGNAVAHGLPWDVALAAITSVPAEIFGLGETHGRIAVGQVADLVLWSGDPLEVTSLADQVWIAGRAVEMTSRQTELRDRYVQRLKGQTSQ